MGLTRKRKIYVGVLAAAFLGLTADQVLLGSSDTNAPEVPVAPDTTTLVETPAVLQAAEQVISSEVADRLWVSVKDRGVLVSSVADAFKMPASWAIESENDADVDGYRSGDDTGLKLSSVMRSQHIAVINGAIIRLGKQIGRTGYRLVEIEARAAIVELDGVVYRLALPGPGSAKP